MPRAKSHFENNCINRTSSKDHTRQLFVVYPFDHADLPIKPIKPIEEEKWNLFEKLGQLRTPSAWMQ